MIKHLSKSRRLSRHALINTLIILIALISLIPLYFYLTKQAEAAPWSAVHGSWQKRKQLTLTNNSGSTLNANVPYQITVDTTSTSPQNTGDYQPDCDDLRVVYQPDSSTNTELARAYHIAQGATTCTNSGATIVTFPLQASITNGSSSTSYYLYYANPSIAAPNASALSAYNFSSKTATFVAPFNGTGTALAAGTGTPTTTSGSVRYSGNKGSAMNFNGKSGAGGDFVSVSTPSLASGDFTIESWVNLATTTPSTAFIFWTQAAASPANCSGGWNGVGLSIINSSGNKLQFGTRKTDATNYALLSSSTVPLNTWTHVAATYSLSTTTLKLYINGVNVATDAAASSFCANLTTSNNIGNSFGGNGAFPGLVDEMRLSNTVRYTTTFTPPTSSFTRDSNTTNLYHFDENGDDPRNTGKTIDDSGNANHGTITGAKYVSGLIGVDNSVGSTATATGNSPIQSYAGHQGIVSENSVTNKITNPSFEATTYDIGWTAAGANLTATVNTTAPFYKFGNNSEKLVANASAISTTSNMRTINVNPGALNAHFISAYVYEGTSGNIGGTVSGTIAKLVYNGTSQTTTYTNMGGGWWRLSFSTAGITSPGEFGIEVQPSKTIYVDGYQLELAGANTPNTYTDGSLGTGYAWSGTDNNSSSTKTRTSYGYSLTNNLSINQGSISMWYKKLSPIQASLLTHAGTSSTAGVSIGLTAAGVSGTIYNSGSGVTCGTNGSSIDVGEWHHITLVWRANSGGSDSCQIYSDGASTGSGPSGQSWTTTASTTLGIGYSPASSAQQSEAIISDYRVYDTILTATDIADLYNVGLGASAQSTQEKDAPNAYWKFDEGQGTTANNAGSAGSVLSGTLTNTPTWQTENFCILGKCLWFDGTSDESVSKGDNDNLDFGITDGFSVGGWVKRNGTSSAINYIVSKADTSTGGYKLWMDADGDLCFGIDDDGTWGPDISACSDTNGDFDDNRWHYVTGVRDATSDTVKVYVDGLVKDSQTDPTTTTLANTNTFYIGVDRDGTSNEWLGFIDEVKVFPTILSADQVKVQYNLGAGSVLGTNTQNLPDALSDGLVGYWKMDQSSWNGTSGEAVDSSGNANNGTAVGGATTATGKFSYSGSFDGTDDYANLGTPSSLNVGNNLTVSAWINPTSLSGRRTIYTERIGSSGSAAGQFQVEVGASNGTNTVAVATNGNFDATTSNNVVTTNAWQHVVYTRNGTGSGSQKIYVNGVLQTLAADSPVNINGESGSQKGIGVGAAGNTAFFAGSLDEVKVYNRPLSGAEVSQLYNWAPGPVGYWNYESQSTTTVTDYSGNANSGTWSGSGSPHITPGKYGKGGNFSPGGAANGDVLTIGTPSLLNNIPNSGGMTVGTWFKSDANKIGVSASYRMIIKSNIANTGWYIQSANHSSRQLTFAACFTGGCALATSGVVYNNNEWAYATLVVDTAASPPTVKGYVNGVLVASTTGSGTYVSDSAINLTLGCNASCGSQEWYGQQDELRIYNYVRTQAQIIEDLNASHPAPGSPVSSTVATWKLDEGYGTSAQDFSGNTNTLTLSTATAAWTNSGKFLKAFDGNGTRYMSRADDADFDVTATDDYSVSLWFKSDSASNPAATEYLFNKENATNPGYAIYVNTSGQFCFGIDDDTTWGPDIASCTTADFYDATWHHLTAVRDVTLDKIYIYIDAYEKDSDTDTTSATLANALLLYVADRDGTDNADEFNGDVDEIKVYRSPLTPPQVKLDMNRSSSEVLGALGTSSTLGNDNASTRTAQSNASLYCVPGDSTTCTAPAGEWKLDEGSGTTANDSSGTGNTGTITAGTGGYTNGKYNKAYRFDGSTTAINVGNASGLQVSTGTIQAWIKTANAGSSYRGIVCKNAAYNMYLKDNVFMVFDPGAAADRSSGVNLADNKWHHVAVTFTSGASNGTLLYIDGVLRLTTVITYSNQANALMIGNCVGTSQQFAGTIDQVSVFNYARTPAQIAWDYNQGKPIAHYKMDECSGTVINDMSGNSYTGTLTNATAGTCQTSGAWFNGVTGKRNYSVDLDTDDYIQVSDTANLRFDAVTADFSLFAWVKRASNGEMNIISKEDADNDGYRLQFTSGNVVRCSVDSIDIDSTLTITDTNWHFVGCTIDRDGNGQVYLDGQANGTATAISSEVMANTANLRLGARAYTAANYLDGLIDETKIYNYALTATQIKTLYNDGATRYGPVTGSP